MNLFRKGDPPMTALRRFLLLFLASALLFSALPAAGAEDGELLRLHMIDIGCGDAYLLTVGDLVMLIDCGTNCDNRSISEHIYNRPLFEYLEASGIDHVDMHIVTHWHNDHCYNVNMLMEKYGSDDTVVYGVSAEIFRDLSPLAGGTYRRLNDGDRFSAGPLDILCIGPEYMENRPGIYNHDSLNFIVTYGSCRFLFTGDWMDKTVYDRWKDEIADVDVFHFPHHGMEPLYITKECMHQANPRVILITGRQRGLVKQFVRQAGLDMDAVVYLSVMDKNCMVICDGENLWTATGVGPGEFPAGDPVPPRAVPEEP